MSVSITHAKVSGKAAGSDPDRVYGVHWDADHVVPVATTAEAQAATSDTVLMTPAKTLDLVNANVPSGSALTKADDTNVTLTLGGTPTTALLRATSITVGWTGTLAAARLNANVVQGVTNDTNITGAIAAQNLTLGWTGTLAAARLNANVVQGVTNDTNVTGSIATQNLTLGWTGTLSPARGGTGVANNAASTITISGNFGTTFTVSGATTLTLPTTGTLATLAGTEELDNKTLDSSVGKGTWTASGTWTLPAVTLGGAITYGGVTLSNAVTGTGKMVLDTSPTLSNPVVGTQTARDNSTKAASTAYVDSAVRERLSANRTYYVRNDGSNSNDGLTNSAGGAFLTWQKAWDVLVTIDLNGYTCTIQAGTSSTTFTNGLNATVPPIGGNVILDGNGGTINTTSGHAIVMSCRGTLTIQSVTLTTTTAGFPLVCAYGGKVVIGSSVTFGAAPGAYNHMRCEAGGYILGQTAYSITGAANAHYQCLNGGLIEVSSVTVTMSGSLNFGTAFAYCDSTGVISAFGMTYSGTTITVTIASPGVVTYTGHGLLANAPIAFATTGALPTGLTAATTYYVKTVLDANTFTLSATPGGAVINTSGSQSGVHTVLPTGKRYDIQTNGVVNTGGSGASYFPGNAAGTTATGGQYA